MKPVKFYEITEKEGQDAVWGGASATEAVEWFRRGLDRRVFVSNSGYHNCLPAHSMGG
jgi:hypothetical protein